MTYAFRKYLNKRGSALFMVLSLMTALMILVMAMYFSVVSSRDVQYKVFYQEQAYRSATSLSDAMVAGLKNQSWQTSGTSLLDAILALDKEGDFITTNGNDFKAFVADGTNEEQAQLGAYTATITRMKDEKFGGKTTRVFDIAITTSSGGVLDTMHTYIHIAEPDAEATQGKTNIFTSTGYVPNDVHLDRVETWTDLFYDNEYVVISGESHIYSNLSCGGSLNLDQCSASPGARDGSDSSYNKPATWAIRNHFTNSTGTTLKMSPSSSDRGLILVGGDLTIEGNFDNADIYVLGNAYYKSGNMNGCRVFINGELRSVGGANPPSFPVYASGKGDDISISLTGSWTGMTDEDRKTNNVLSRSDMADMLDQLTASNQYAKWKINDDDSSDTDTYIKYLNEDAEGYIGEEVINFDSDHRTYYLDWKTTYSLPNYFGQGQTLNYTPYVIGDITSNWEKKEGDESKGNDNFAAIVIDTGDDPNNQVILKLNPNRNYDTESGNETFSWMPKDAGAATDGMSVIVRGKGSVVIDIPEGVIYQASDNTSVMHETWYALLGGSIDQYGSTRETLGFRQKDGTADGFLKDPTVTLKFIHTDCNEDCGCVYTTDTSSDKCSECGKKVVKEITCEEHQMTYTFCPDCHPELEPAKNNKGYYGLCANHVERSEVATAVGNLDSVWQSQLKESGDGTNWYYPNTNIFLVSCDESADIRLAYDEDGAPFSNSSFWGFVYAPYMTYKGMGNGSGWTVFGGGMIVADYVIKNYDIYIACFPDQLPEDLMSETNRKEMLDPVSSKSWKIDLAGY